MNFVARIKEFGCKDRVNFVAKRDRVNLVAEKFLKTNLRQYFNCELGKENVRVMNYLRDVGCV